MEFKRNYDERTSASLTHLIVEGHSDYYSRGNNAQIDELQGKVETLSNFVDIIFMALPAETQKTIADQLNITILPE
jgi:hypothetical protein